MGSSSLVLITFEVKYKISGNRSQGNTGDDVSEELNHRSYVLIDRLLLPYLNTRMIDRSLDVQSETAFSQEPFTMRCKIQ